MEPLLVIGYTWSGGEVRLRLVDEAGAPRDRTLDGALSLAITETRRCTGYAAEGQRIACPDAAVPTGAQCDACAARDRFRPCMTCDGFRCPRLDPSSRAHCRGRHHLYLACFGDSNLKVGTAAHARRDQRVIEQGPLAAARVAAGEGPLVKQMEHLLASEGPFTERVRRSRKTALLRGAMTAEEAEDLVQEASTALRMLLPPRYHGLLHPPEPVPQPELAVRSRALLAARDGTAIALPVVPGTTIEGRVVGAVGHLIALAEPHGVFTLDLGALRSRVVVFDPEGPRRRPMVQLGLF